MSDSDDSAQTPVPAASAGSFLRSFTGPSGRGFVPDPFKSPEGLLCDAERGCLVVMDSGNHRVIAVHRRSLEVMWQYGVMGTAGSAKKQLNEPRHAVLLGRGDDALLLVTDSGNHRIVMLRAADGTFVAAFGARGSANGQFRQPTGIVVGDDNLVWVADTLNHRVQCFDVSEGPKAWRYVRQLGQSDVAGSGSDHFNCPQHVAFDDGRLFVADSLNHRVQVLEVNAARLFVRSIGTGAPSIKPGELSAPHGVVISNGALYVTEAGNHRVSVFRADSLALIGVFAGIGVAPGLFLGARGACVDQEAHEILVTDVNSGQAVSVFETFF
jgi:tripartite motif-containing protein 71